MQQLIFYAEESIVPLHKKLKSKIVYLFYDFKYNDTINEIHSKCRALLKHAGFPTNNFQINITFEFNNSKSFKINVDLNHGDNTFKWFNPSNDSIKNAGSFWVVWSNNEFKAITEKEFDNNWKASDNN